jgi:hypothetical protein
MYYIYNQNLELLTTVQAQKLDNYAGAIQLINGGEVIVSIPHSLIVSSVPLFKPTTGVLGEEIVRGFYDSLPTPVNEVKSPEELKALNILKEKANEGSYAPISELADKGYQGEPYISHLLQFVDREEDKLVYFTADNIDKGKHFTHYYYEGKLIHMSKVGEKINIISTHIKFPQSTIVKLYDHTPLYIADLIEVNKQMVILYLKGEKIIAVKRSDFKLLSPSINFKF